MIQRRSLDRPAAASTRWRAGHSVRIKCGGLSRICGIANLARVGHHINDRCRCARLFEWLQRDDPERCLRHLLSRRFGSVIRRGTASVSPDAQAVDISNMKSLDVRLPYRNRPVARDRIAGERGGRNERGHSRSNEQSRLKSHTSREVYRPHSSAIEDEIIRLSPPLRAGGRNSTARDFPGEGKFGPGISNGLERGM